MVAVVVSGCCDAMEMGVGVAYGLSVVCRKSTKKGTLVTCKTHGNYYE